MFVERSEARVRSARTAFVLSCLIPAAGIVAWAAYRATDLHRDVAMAEWARGIGLGVRCGRMVHVRPGCVRLVDCDVREDGGAAARFDIVEIETTPAEVRIRLPSFDATPEACAAVGRMARSWLTEPTRHGRNWMVDARAVRWREPPVDATALRAGIDAAAGSGDERGLDAGFRVECVAVGDERAVRIRREPANGDEVRLARSVVDGRVRFAVDGSLTASVPASCVLAAMVGRPSDISGWCSGSIAIESAAEVWEGDIACVLDGFRADTIPGFFASPWRLDGRGRFDLVRGTVVGGRLSRAEATLDIGNGRVSQGLLDRFVQVAQCRAGEAYRGTGVTAAADMRPFDRIALTLAIDAVGLTIRPSGPASDGIVTIDGRAILRPPVDVIAAERLPWAFAPADARPLPASGATAWLVPLLPAEPATERR